jgi:hypothetical protein
MDLVGTCPMTFWNEWLAEGDCAGEVESGEEWGWYTRDRLASEIRPGDRFYVVAHGLLRGYAIVTRVVDWDPEHGAVICRRGGAVAVTILRHINGFRGLRRVWWDRGEEVPFPKWRTEGVPLNQRRQT